MAENPNTGNNKFINQSYIPPVDINTGSTPEISSQEHEDITDAIRESTIQFDRSSEIDPMTLKFIDQQSKIINEQETLNPSRFTSPYPGNATPNRNPFAYNTGQNDLGTQQGRRDYFGSILERANGISDTRPHGGAWQNPIIYGKRQVNADRYLSHPSFDELGFHPYRDNETFYNQNSTWYDDLGRTSSAFVQMFKPAFTSGWRSLGDFISGDGLSQDYIGAEAMQDAMRIASSTRGGATGFMNDLYLNSAYTFGILGSIFAEEVALGLGTVATKGMSSSIAASRTAGNFKRLFDAADAMKTGARNVGNFSYNIMRDLGAVDKAKDFYNYAKGNMYGDEMGRFVSNFFAPETTRALQTMNSTKNTAKNLSNISKLNTTFGAFYRDVRQFNIAWAESKMEGGLREIETLEEAYLKALQKNGGNPLTEEQYNLIHTKSKSAGLKTALLNFPIIYLSNKIVFDGALRGFKGLGRQLDNAKSGLGKKLMRNTKDGVVNSGKKAYVNVGSGLKRMYREGIVNGFKAAGVAGLRYSTRNFAEGLQELSQELVSASVGDYYTGLFDEVLADSMNANSAELESRVKNAEVSMAQAISSGLNNEAVGFKTFMSGFLMGGLVQPFQTVMFEYVPNTYTYVTDRKKYDEYAKKKEDYINEASKTLTEMFDDPRNLFKLTNLNTLTQKQLNKFMLLSSYNNDIMAFKDSKDAASFHHVLTMLNLGKGEDFKAHINAILQMNDSDLQNAFKDTEASPAEIRKRFTGLVDKVDTMREKFDKFDDKYINPYNPDNFKQGSRPWAQEIIRQHAFEHAKMMFMFTNDTYERSVVRMESILNNLSVNPVIDKMAANDITALTSQKGMLAEINMLKDETSVVPAKNASVDLKNQYKNKQEKLKIFQEFYDTFYSKDNYTILRKTKDKIKYGKLKVSGKNKLKKVFIKLLDHLSKTTDSRIQDNDAINTAFEMIIDHEYLAGRASDYYQAARILDDPSVLNDLADRSAEAMSKVWNDQRKKFKVYGKLKNWVNNQERAKIISDLAKVGIYAESKQAKNFIETGEEPNEFFSEESRLTAITAEENPNAWKTLTNIFKGYQKQKEAEAKASKDKAGQEIEVNQDDFEKDSDLNAGDEINSVPEVEEERGSQISQNVQPRIYTEKDYQKFIDQDPNTQSILNKKYQEYEYAWNKLGVKKLAGKEGQILNKSEWVNSNEGGGKIVKARHRLFRTYAMQSPGMKSKTTFEEYLTKNQNQQFLINTVQRYGLRVEDILLDTVVNENISVEQGLNPNKETVVDTGIDYAKHKIKIIRKKRFKTEEDTAPDFFMVLTLNNENTIDKFAGLPNANINLKTSYETQEEAVAAADWLIMNMPTASNFDFTVEGKVEDDFTSGEVVVKDKRRYSVESKQDDNSMLVKDLESGQEETIPAGKFASESWTRSKDEKIVIADVSKSTKLFVNRALQILPFDPNADSYKTMNDPAKEKILKAQSRTDFEKTLQQLTPDEINDLKFSIIKGEDFEKIITNTKGSDRDVFPASLTYDENEQIRVGAAKYRVVVYKGDKPFALLASPYTATMVDSKGNDIDPLTITQKQAETLFIGAQADPTAYKKIRSNYASAYEIEQIFKEELEKTKGDEAFMSFKDLQKKKIQMQFTSGYILYKSKEVVDGKPINNQSSLEELANNGFTVAKGIGIDGNPLFLIEDNQVINRNAKEKDEVSIITNVSIKDKNALDNLRSSILISMKRQGFNPKADLGRYVSYVYSPGLDEFTAFELKTKPKSQEEVNTLFTEYLTRMEDTVKNNLDKGTVKDELYNRAFSTEKELDNFISGKSGQKFSISVTSRGDLKFRYYNGSVNGLGKNIFLKLKDVRTLLQSEAGVTALLKTIDKKINNSIVTDKKLNPANIIQKLNDPQDLLINLKVENFKQSLPKNINSNSNKYTIINSKMDAVIGPNVRANIYGNIVTTDTPAIQNRIQAALDNKKEPVVKTKTVIEKPLSNVSLTNNDYFKKQSKEKFANIDEAILKEIANKIVKDGKESLTTREKLALQNTSNSRRVSEFMLEITSRQASYTAQKEAENSEEQKEVDNEIKLRDQLKILQKEKYNNYYQERSLKTIDGQRNTKYIEKEGDRRSATLSDVNLDQEIQALKEKINSSFKIVDTEFDGRDIEDINKFITWLKANLPEDIISIKDINDLSQRLKNQGTTVGAFIMRLKTLRGKSKTVGEIYTSKDSPFRYHEAFHATFRLLLTEDQITDFLSVAKKAKKAELKKEGKSLESALKELALLSPTYSAMNKKELEDTLYEEYLADEFEKFKQSPTSTKIDSKVKSFFTKLLEMITKIFENAFKVFSGSALVEQSTDPQLNKLFQDIDSGKFKSSKTQENRFTNAVAETSGGISNPVYAIVAKQTAIIPVTVRRAGELVTLNRKIVIPFPAEQVDSLVKRIAATYTQLKNRFVPVTGNLHFSKSKNIREAADMVIQMYNPSNSQYDQFSTDIDKIFELEEIYNALNNPDNKKALANGVRDYINIVEEVDNVLEDNIDVAENEEKDAPYQANEKRNQMGGFSNLNEMIRMFILTTTVDVQDDRFGNTFINPDAAKADRIPLQESVNYIEVFNGLLKALSGTDNPATSLAKMYLFAESNRETQAVVDRFFTEFFGNNGPQLVKDFVEGKIEMPKTQGLKGAEFFQKTMNAFHQFRVDYIIGLKDKNTGNTSLIAANKNDDTHWQLQRWSTAFDNKNLTKGSTSYNVIIKELKDLENLMVSGETLSDSEVKTKGVNVAEVLDRHLGVIVSPKFIEYSLLSAMGAKTSYQKSILTLFEERPITINDENQNSDIQEIIRSLQREEQLYNETNNDDSVESEKETTTNYSEQTSTNAQGVFYRLQKWAIANAAFDERVGSTVMLDPKGNYIYSHQTPTYHLEIAQKLNSANGINSLINERPDLVSNMLLKDPKFLALSDARKLSIIRSLGTKTTTFTTTKDGQKIENKSLDTNDDAKSYGDYTPAEFLADRINLYLLNFNDLNGKVAEEDFYNEDTDEYNSFTYSPVLLRVMSDSNMGDLQNMPVVKVQSKKNTFAKEYLEQWRNLIEDDYKIIQTNTKELRDATLFPIRNINKGYNDIESSDIDFTNGNLNPDLADLDKARGFKMGLGTADVLTIRKVGEQKQFDESLKLHLEKVARSFKKDGSQYSLQEAFDSFVSETVEVADIPAQQANRKDTIKRVLVERKSQTSITELPVEEQELYDSPTIELYENAVSTYEFMLSVIKGELYISAPELGINKPLQESVKTSIERSNTEEIEMRLDDLKNSFIITKAAQPVIKAPIKGVSDADIKEMSDENYKELVETGYTQWLDNNGEVVEASYDISKIKADTTKDAPKRNAGKFILDALEAQYERFESEIKDLGADSLIDNRIKKGLAKTGNTEFKNNARISEALLFLSADEKSNLRQIYFNNWLQTTRINDVYLPNQSMSLKDAVDAIKRAKMQNAGGANTESYISAPELGINKPLQELHVLIGTDPLVKKQYDVDGEDQKSGEQTDGQGYMTTKTFRATWFGLGKLTENQADMLNKIERNEAITEEEFFGAVEETEAGLDSLGYKDYKSQINSKKYVYGDGSLYFKLSYTILTPALDSYADGTMLESRRFLYNLRTTLEAKEKRDDVFMMYIFESASKMRKTNILDRETSELLFDQGLTIGERFEDSQFLTDMGKKLEDAVEIVPAKYMRLQQITPSNKMETIDPRQIQNLILNEQNDNQVVNFMGEEVTVGDIKKMYQWSISNRKQLNYLNRHSLIFDLQHGLDYLQEAIDKNEVTPNLEAFVDYGQNSLQASQASTTLLEYFSKTKLGESKYELNNPVTIQKLTELTMSFFSKGVIADKQPGKAVVLISDFGMNVFKRVDAIDNNGTPTAWTVITTEGWKQSSAQQRAALVEPTKNPKGDLIGLSVDQVYVDRLRHDVVDYKRNNKGKLIRENGKLVPTGEVYTEFMLPPHFREEMQLNPGDPIPNAIAKQFAVRIPSQDKHSATNLKLVDHLPVFMGSSGVVARELMEIVGLDFDIDKFYIHHKDFYENETGELVEYGKGRTAKERYQEYLMASEKDMLKSGTNMFYAYKKWRQRLRKDLEGTLGDFAIVQKNILDEFEEYAVTSETAVEFSMQGKGLKDLKEAFAKERGYDYDSKADEFYLSPVEETSVEEPNKQAALLGSLKILNLPVTIEQYEQFREDNKFVTESGVTLFREPYAQAHSNNILDFKMLLLGNDSMSKAQGGRLHAIKNEPAVDKPFVTIWNSWKDKLPNYYENNRVDLNFSVNNINGQTKYYKDSKEGARNIGAVVQPNTYLGWHKIFKTKLREGQINKNGIYVGPPKLNGHTYRNYDINYFIDPSNGKQLKDGERIQYAMSALVSIMVDNGKNPYAAKLGLNKQLVVMVANAIALGINLETALLLVNQPIIQNAFKQSNVTGKNPIAKLRSDYNVFMKSEKPLNTVSMGTEVTDPFLEDLIRKGERPLDKGTKQSVKKDKIKVGGVDYIVGKTEIDVVKEMAGLREFLNLNYITSANSNLASIAALAESMGRDLDAIANTNKNLNDLGLFLDKEDYLDARVMGDPIPFEYNFVKGITNINSIPGINTALFKHFTDLSIPYLLTPSTQTFISLENFLTKGLKGMSPKRIVDAKSKIRKDLLSYLTIKSYMHNLNLLGESGQESLASLNNALIYNEMEGSIRIDKEIEKVKDFLKATNQKNEFINFFIRNDKNGTKKNKTGINRVKTQNLVKLSNNKSNRIQTSLISLLKDKTTRSAVTHLIHYEMVKNGFQQKAGSFLQVIAPALPDIQMYLGEAKRVKDVLSTKFKNINEVDDSFKNTFGLTLDETLQDLSQWFRSSKDSYYIPRIGKNVQFNITKGVRSPMYIKDNKFIVDYYQGTTEIAKYKSKNPNDKRIKIPKQKIDIEKASHDILTKSGFNRSTLGFIFPQVVSVSQTVSDGSSLTKYYYLNKLYSPYTKGKTNTNLYAAEKVANALVGTTAEYIQFDLLGSKDQWKMGFMFNIAKINGKTQLQPTATEIRNRQNLINEQVIPYVEDFYGEEDMGFVPPVEPRNTVSSTDINLVEATNDKIDFKKGNQIVGSTETQDPQTIINANVVVDKKKVAPLSAFNKLKADIEANPQDLKNLGIETTYAESSEEIQDLINDGWDEIGTTEDGFPKFSREIKPKQKTTQVNTSKAEGVGAKFSKDKLGPQTKKDNNYIDVIRDWFQSTPVGELNKAAEANMLSGARLKDFVSYYEKTKNVTNLEDFMYRLKNCK